MNRGRSIVVRVAGVLIAAVVVPGCSPRPEEVPVNRPASVPSQPGASATPRPADFVGSRACAACHAEISALFAAHPMGRSLGPLDAIERIEVRSDGPVARDREREYLVTHHDGVTLHAERVSDDTGVIYEQAVPMHFALGSGRRGRAYLSARGGRIFQSPIGWYTQRQGWDLSPGYRDNRSLRFEREIDDSCLYCHVGRTEPAPAAGAGRFTERIFSEAAIGCERCHGPGGRHVALMEARTRDEPASNEPREHTVAPDGADGATDSPTDIVNPARLGRERREAVCNQCHLAGMAAIPRSGKGFFDFRPGDLLDDTLVVLVSGEGNSRAAVSHVEQMRASRCFTESGGALGCTSCHDPHTTPSADNRAAFYQDRCAACHSEEACGRSLSRADEPAGGSCIGCHMPKAATADVPHTALTDHRIVRHTTGSPAAVSGKPGSPRPDERPSIEGAARLPQREVDRARGLWQATRAVRHRDAHLAAEAVTLLVGAPTPAPGAAGVPDSIADDVPVLLALGELLAATGRAPLASACYGRALTLDAMNEAALAGLSDLATRSGDPSAALEFADRLAAARPLIAEAHARRATLLAALERWSECRDAVQRAIALDPTVADTRRLLAEACRHLGDDAAAVAVEDRLRRLARATGADRDAGDP